MTNLVALEANIITTFRVYAENKPFLKLVYALDQSGMKYIYTHPHIPVATKVKYSAQIKHYVSWAKNIETGDFKKNFF